jgi:hypothetical protein
MTLRTESLPVLSGPEQSAITSVRRDVVESIGRLAAADGTDGMPLKESAPEVPEAMEAAIDAWRLAGIRMSAGVDRRMLGAIAVVASISWTPRHPAFT